MTPDQLLFTDLEGRPLSLPDVIADGLDRDYSARFPLLRRLLDDGTPREQLYACAMLASWGVRDGFLKLIDWARAPEAVPWAADSVELDRFFGVDAAFVLLTDALRWAQHAPLTEVAARLRRLAIYDLLVIYPLVYFDRSMFVLLNLDHDLAWSEQGTITWAIEQALTAARNSEPDFDLPTQIAYLIGPLAALDDVTAADRAEILLAYYPGRERTLRELAYALGLGTGPATLSILERLASSDSSSVRREATECLLRRAARVS
jgi:hypothetical protein